MLLNPHMSTRNYVVPHRYAFSMGKKSDNFLGGIIVFLVIAVVLFLIVAFIHDAWTGQLPGGGGGGGGGEDYGDYDGFGRR